MSFKKSVIAASVAMAVMAVAEISSANVTSLTAGTGISVTGQDTQISATTGRLIVGVDTTTVALKTDQVSYTVDAEAGTVSFKTGTTVGPTVYTKSEVDTKTKMGTAATSSAGYVQYSIVNDAVSAIDVALKTVEDKTQKISYSDSTTTVAGALQVGSLAVTNGSTAKTYITSNGMNANNQKITNVLDGDISSATSTDAVNGGQLYATNLNVTANKTAIDTHTADNVSHITADERSYWNAKTDKSYVDSSVHALDKRMEKKVNRLGAKSAAIAALHPMPFDEDHKVSASVGAGTYGGEGAAAVGVFYRPTENLMFNVAGAAGSGCVMGNLGMSYRFGGSGSSVNTLTKSQMATELYALKDTNRSVEAQLKAALSREEASEKRHQNEMAQVRKELKEMQRMVKQLMAAKK